MKSISNRLLDLQASGRLTLIVELQASTFLGFVVNRGGCDAANGTKAAVGAAYREMEGGQTAIAEVLLDMDAELAALEQRRDKIRALKQGMMQELLTGRTRLV